MKSVFIKVLRVLMLFIVIISCAVGYVVYEDTLASWWIPVGVALVIAILTLPLYKKWTWLTAGSDKTLNLLCHVVCVGAVSYALFLVGNYCLADPASTQDEKVIVQKKLQKTYKKTRRVGKRRYVSDGVRRNTIYRWPLRMELWKRCTYHSLPIIRPGKAKQRH